MKMQDPMTIAEAARAAGLDYSTVHKAVTSGALPAYTETQKVRRIRAADLRAYMRRTRGKVGRPKLPQPAAK